MTEKMGEDEGNVFFSNSSNSSFCWRKQINRLNTYLFLLSCVGRIDANAEEFRSLSHIFVSTTGEVDNDDAVFVHLGGALNGSGDGMASPTKKV